MNKWGWISLVVVLIAWLVVWGNGQGRNSEGQIGQIEEMPNFDAVPREDRLALRDAIGENIPVACKAEVDSSKFTDEFGDVPQLVFFRDGMLKLNLRLRGDFGMDGQGEAIYRDGVWRVWKEEVSKGFESSAGEENGLDAFVAKYEGVDGLVMSCIRYEADPRSFVVPEGIAFQNIEDLLGV